jgi:DNA (cytosine-5)-methyltransferase 1
MIYGSVCSGIEAASVAWEPLGWKPSFFSEIDAFPRAVLAHRFPEVPLHGDFTTIQAGDYRPIDLLVGGTPCQSFSIAGLRGGLDDDRGNLALEYLRLADRLRPRWLVWENVPGVLSSNGGRDFGSILGGMVQLGYGFAYRVLDAQFFGVAQRRRRVFVVAYLGDWRPAAAVLFEPQGLRGDPPPSREPGQGTSADVAPGLVASGQGVERTGDTRGQDPLVAVAFGGNNTAGAINVATARVACSSPHGRLDFETETFVVEPFALQVRRLTPTECERLQGFPDSWTAIPYRGKPASDGPRYKALGNSMAVPVMAWIGRRIAAVENLHLNQRAA